jgi:hypothetical protein
VRGEGVWGYPVYRDADAGSLSVLIDVYIGSEVTVKSTKPSQGSRDVNKQIAHG